MRDRQNTAKMEKNSSTNLMSIEKKMRVRCKWTEKGECVAANQKFKLTRQNSTLSPTLLHNQRRINELLA